MHHLIFLLALVIWLLGFVPYWLDNQPFLVLNMILIGQSRNVVTTLACAWCHCSDRTVPIAIKLLCQAENVTVLCVASFRISVKWLFQGRERSDEKCFVRKASPLFLRKCTAQHINEMESANKETRLFYQAFILQKCRQ